MQRECANVQIESLQIHNYRVFHDVFVEDIPQRAVFLGQNGAGKTTFFDVFGFLHDCLNSNVRSALYCVSKMVASKIPFPQSSFLTEQSKCLPI